MARVDVDELRDKVKVIYPQYHFISDSAQGATETFGVKSISVLATKGN